MLKITDMLKLICFCPLFTLLFWTSCKDQENCCTIINNAINIKYLNKNDQGLFDDNASYDDEAINLYYKKGKVYEKVYNPNANHPKNYLAYKNENNELIIRVFASDVYEDNFSTTLIELKESVVDTMVCEFELGPSREVCKNVWYNGIKQNSLEFAIIKK